MILLSFWPLHYIHYNYRIAMANSMYEGGYDDSNRAFLQAFMARSTMTFSEAKPLLAAIFSAQGTTYFHLVYVYR